MNGIKVGFNFVDLAKSRGWGIGSVRLKDGSCVKILGDPNDLGVDLFRIKYGKLLEARGYRGEEAVYHAANDVAAIEEHYEAFAGDTERAWRRAFNAVA